LKRSLHRTASAPPAVKSRCPPAIVRHRRPPPAWLNGRCLRCHDVGHWAAMCCEPLRCNNCRQVGHRAKCSTGRTAPRPPPVKVRRATQMPLGVRPRPWQPSPSSPQQQPEQSHHPADLQVQFSLATQAELLRSEL
jgi:hypothetical protein